MNQYQKEIEEIKNKIMNTSQASLLWGMTQDSIKRLCRQKKIASFKLDDDPYSPYIILRDQPNPKKNR